MFSKNTNNTDYVDVCHSSIWDDVVSYFVGNNQSSSLSCDKQNFDAVWPILNSIIENYYCFNNGGVKKDRSRALDFGCGTGNLTRALSGIGFDVFGCDTSSEMIKQARISCCKNIIYEVGGAEIINRQSSFQLITSVMVFQFVRDIESLINMLTTRLDDNGMLFFAVHNLKYVAECIRWGVKFRGISGDTSPEEGEIKIGPHWIPIHVRSLEWYNEIFVAAGMKRVNYLFNITEPPVGVPQIAQNSWESQKYYVAWYTK